MIDVTCKVKNYDNPAKPDMKIHNHWNESDKVVLEINGEMFTFLANDLRCAIENCKNTNRYG